MDEKLLKIPALLSQACAAYPGGKRGVFRAIESAEGRTLSESTFYAALNSNPTAPDALKVSQLVSVMRVTADISALRYLAAMFGQAVVPLDAGKPDAPTVEGEMLQDYPAVVRFHEVARRYQRRARWARRSCCRPRKWPWPSCARPRPKSSRGAACHASHNERLLHPARRPALL